MRAVIEKPTKDEAKGERVVTGAQTTVVLPDHNLGRKVVFVVERQRAKRKEVSVGLGDDDIVEIRQGVSVGDRVVVRGLETLTDEVDVVPPATRVY